MFRVRPASGRHLFHVAAGQYCCHNAVAILSEFDQLCKEGGCDSKRLGRLHNHNDMLHGTAMSIRRRDTAIAITH